MPGKKKMNMYAINLNAFPLEASHPAPDALRRTPQKCLCRSSSIISAFASHREDAPPGAFQFVACATGEGCEVVLSERPKPGSKAHFFSLALLPGTLTRSAIVSRVDFTCALVQFFEKRLASMSTIPALVKKLISSLMIARLKSSSTSRGTMGFG